MPVAATNNALAGASCNRRDAAPLPLDGPANGPIVALIDESDRRTLHKRFSLAFVEGVFKQLGAVNKGDDVDLVFVIENLVQHAVTVEHEELSDVWIVFFRDNSSTFRILTK